MRIGNTSGFKRAVASALPNRSGRSPCGWAAGSLIVFFLTSLVAVPATSRAEENPFGLPEPLDPGRLGAVMLHGGGFGLNDDIRQEFARLAGGKDARILLIPSEMAQRGRDSDGQLLPEGESKEAYERRLAEPGEYGRWVKLKETGQVADFRFLYWDDGEPWDDTEFYRLLSEATGVWMPAGDQESLPKRFADDYPAKTSRFQSALRDVVARGGVVGGLGGGMASFPETIIAGDARAETGWVRANLRFGLALFHGAVVDQNFGSHTGRLERLTDFLRNGPTLDRLGRVPGVERRTIGMGVERQTVLILQGNTVRAMGEGRGHLFLKGNGDRTITWRTLAPGEDTLVLESNSTRPRRAPLVGESNGDVFNPFGMPEPFDPARVGTVVLHGGGSTADIIDLLPNLAGVAKPRMVHCPAARESCRPQVGGDRDRFLEYLEQEFKVWRDLETAARLQKLTFLTTNTPADANREEFIKPLTEAEALWFCGGIQEELARLLVGRLHPTRFQEEAIDIVRRGGVVGGSSAGLAIMPEVMIEGGQSENGLPAQAALSRGLGVLRQVLAEQHFDARTGRIERLTGLLRDHRRLANFSPTSRPKQMIGLAVEEDTALIVQANRVRVTGKNLAHVFVQSNDPRTVTWHALKPGDAAFLLPGNEGYVLELDEWEFR